MVAVAAVAVTCLSMRVENRGCDGCTNSKLKKGGAKTDR